MMVVCETGRWMSSHKMSYSKTGMNEPKTINFFFNLIQKIVSFVLNISFSINRIKRATNYLHNNTLSNLSSKPAHSLEQKPQSM